MCRRTLSLLALVLLGVALTGRARAGETPPGKVEVGARAILEQLESPRGICAIIGDREARLALGLARSSELLIYVQLTASEDVEAARRLAHASGLLNQRVYIERGSRSHLHLASHLADVVVVTGEAADRVPREEVERVLRPGGKGLLGAKTVVKAFPEGIDDWSHPYHGPDNNPQSTDRVARAPYLTQFLAEPWYCPMPEVTVASGGRVFKAFGSRAFRRPQWPMLNALIAMNGYNGTVLWRRSLDPDFMIHRNTMIATPEALYLGDAVSCKVLDAVDGELRDEIKVEADLGDGPVWKWMALEQGTLYALVGEKEPPGDALKGPAFRGAGWPWWNIPRYAWGFGRTILALDPATKKILWHHRESEPLDTRAMCMKGGRIYFYSHKKFLGCLDAQTGNVVWKTDNPEVLGAIGEHRPAQRAVWGFASTSYVKSSDDALYFAGPQRTRLVAVSTRDGKLLWKYPSEGNFQLVLREEGLYAMGSNHRSMKIDPLSGELLLRLPNRAACTRATGSIDRVFVRGGGTRCWDVAAEKWLHISPMRPACHDGVVIAGGLLYWGPWMCGCNLSLLGVIALGPRGGVDPSAKATEDQRLERLVGSPSDVAPLPQGPDDWPTYRRDNARSACSSGEVAQAVAVRWNFQPDAANVPTAPVAVGGLVFLGGSDGAVRAIDAADGRTRWVALTGGAIKFPPSISQGRALVGSADGWIHALEAQSGRPLWRFRAAPFERKIPVYGSLYSTWPVAGGVLVEDGVAYAAAGIANYDGTHVYALDAATGEIRWQNNDSGMTAGGQGAGVSVQGHLLLADKKLHLAGGNRIAVASYDLADGRFIRADRRRRLDRRGPPGKDLILGRDGSVVASGRFPLHSRPEDFHYIEQAELPCPAGAVAVTTESVALLERRVGGPGRPRRAWAGRPFNENVAVAVSRNTVLVAGTDRRFGRPDDPPEETHGVAALHLGDGKTLWRHPLRAGPVGWGLAIDRSGHVLVALRDGSVVCLAPGG